MLLTQIVNGQVTDLALCETCARKKGLFDPQSLTFAEKFFPEEFKAKVDELVRELTEGRLAEKQPSKHPDALTKCPACQFSLETYRKTGRLGCPDCYTVFARELSLHPIANDEPSESTQAEEKPNRVQMEKKLREAIEREDYETAAKLRDQLKNL